jgi:DNA gyrase subunit A
MADQPVPEKKEHNVRFRPVEDEMKESYLDYAMSVIISRALPDVRDGLKPVHRRILYAMYDMGMTHDKPYKKCARIVGEVLGKYHPHGDQAVYDSLVRMVQEFSLRYPLADGQGNFGSIDGDPAAAMRYTEARLAKTAEDILEDIEKNTVNFRPNFDNTLQEPVILPSKMPNLLINGTSGIAVGMATNMPPHNITEIINAIVKAIDSPDVTVHDLMQYIKGPDFPTGGIVSGYSGLIEAYTTGRGRIIVRGRTEIEDHKEKKRIIVNELPYQVNKAALIENIADLVRDKKITGITNIRDESDKEGVRIVIDVRKDTHPDLVLSQLYKHTQLQTTFGIINLVLLNDEPKVLGLKDLITEYIQHRKNVVTRRCTFDLDKAEKRAHIVDGIVIALENIDEVVDLIKAAKDADIAKNRLMEKFSLSLEQSQAILDTKLQKLTGLEQEKLRQEKAELVTLIKDLRDILANESRILDIIKKELLSLKEKYGDKRKTEIEMTGDLSDITEEELVKKEDVIIMLTKDNYIKRLPVGEYKTQRRGGKGVIGVKTKEEDIVIDVFAANTHDMLLFFTNKGKVYWLKTFRIPDVGRYGKGRAVINLVSLEDCEKIVSLKPIKSFEKGYLFFATKNGIVKKTALSEYSNQRSSGIIAIKLRDDDELVKTLVMEGDEHVILATKNGLAIRFSGKDARPISRGTMGVTGIRMRKGDEVIGATLVKENHSLLTLAEKGYGKRTDFAEYTPIKRGGRGVINIRIVGKNGNVIGIGSVTETDEIIAVTEQGFTIRVPVCEISKVGRATQGVRVMKLNEGDSLVSFVKISREEGTEQNGREACAPAAVNETPKV